MDGNEKVSLGYDISLYNISFSYFKGKISRTELEITARKFLGHLHIPLHNEFIFAILHNSRPQIQPPPSDAISVAIRTARLSLKPPPDAQRVRNLKRTLTKMLSSDERERLLSRGSLNASTVADGTLVQDPSMVSQNIVLPVVQFV